MKVNKQEIEKVLDGLKRMRIAMFNYCIDGERIKPFLDTAISALEKQIPKKITSTLSCKNVCPSCECAVHKVLRTDKYCQSCGQAIDWRNEDE